MARFVASRLRALAPDHAEWTPGRLDALERGDLHAFYEPLVDRAAPGPGVGLPGRLKADYLRLQAAAWIEAHGEALSNGEIAALLHSTRPRRGASPLLLASSAAPSDLEEARRRLWRQHKVLSLPLLKAPVRLTAKPPAWVRAALPELALRAAPARERDVWSDGSATFPVLSNRAAIVVDRASRAPDHWARTDAGYAYRHDGEVELHFYSPEIDAVKLHELHGKLDVRTSDVWRLLLAKALESGSGQVYEPITVDVRELARAMGYEPHAKGGMRPEHLQAVSGALEHLECFWITLRVREAPSGGSKSPPKGRVQEKTLVERRDRVLAIMSKDLERPLLGVPVPLRWRIALGPWVHAFPRSYAHIFRSLVELPARDGVATWCKQIGTELAYLYRQDRAPDDHDAARRRQVKPIRVRTLLERASLLDEVARMRARNHHKRAMDRFEEVLDKLQGFGVLEAWGYAPASEAHLAKVERRPGSFDAWLDATLHVRAPIHLIDTLPRLTPRQVANDGVGGPHDEL